jgi:hypothetical protein
MMATMTLRTKLQKVSEDKMEHSFCTSLPVEPRRDFVEGFLSDEVQVRIISKSVGCGFKLHVVMDTTTSYVLKVLVYTGKYTYQQGSSESLKKRCRWYNSWWSRSVDLFVLCT